MKHFPISILNADELYTSAKNINTVVEESSTGDNFIISLQPLYRQTLSDLGIILGKDTISDFTGLLFETDLYRDDKFKGLRNYSQSFIYNDDPEKKAAGKLLTENFQKNGWSLSRYGYMKESISLNLLFEDLDKEDAQNALRIIDAVSLYNGLKKAQQKFDDVYLNKISAESRENYPKLQETRKQLTRYLNGMLCYIDIKQEINPDVFTSVVDKIDQVITDIVSVARARKTRKENKQDENVDESL